MRLAETCKKKKKMCLIVSEQQYFKGRENNKAKAGERENFRTGRIGGIGTSEAI